MFAIATMTEEEAERGRTTMGKGGSNMYPD